MQDGVQYRKGENKFVWFLGAVISCAYLMNPTLGIFEALPDNIPLIGNLDEAGATVFLVYCLGKMGIRLPLVPAEKQTPMKKARGRVVED